MKKTIYLANPYGFSAQQKTALLPPFVRILESFGRPDKALARWLNGEIA